MGWTFQFTKKGKNSCWRMVFQAFKALTIFVWESKVFPSSFEEGILNTSFCLLAPIGSIPPTGCHSRMSFPAAKPLYLNSWLAYSSLNQTGLPCRLPSPPICSTNIRHPSPPPPAPHHTHAHRHRVTSAGMRLCRIRHKAPSSNLEVHSLACSRWTKSLLASEAAKKCCRQAGHRS